MPQIDSTTGFSELDVQVWRGKSSGKLEHYKVPMRENQTVLDVVTEIQRLQEPTLAYRYACRVGVCGSCAMTVNGKPRWTCRSHVKDVIAGNKLVIEPLRSHPVIKDLVVDLSIFFDKWQRAGGNFVGTKTRHDKPAVINPNNKLRAAANAGIECINCAVCYSACDVVAWDENYLGPAALNRAWTLVTDERHAERKQTLNKAMADGGCASCHSMGNCTKHCPVNLSPSMGIAALKRTAFRGLPKTEKSISE